MTIGRLGAADLVANTDTSLYTVPALNIVTANLNICNRNSIDAQVRIAIIDGLIGTLSNSDYIEYDSVIPGNGVLERTGLVLGAGQTIAIRSDLINVNATLWGFEESA